MEKTLYELWEQLRMLPPDQEYTEQTKQRCFSIMEQYCALPETVREEHSNVVALCGTAIRLSGIVEKGLSQRVIDFLDTHEEELHERAVQVLRGNIQRMAGF